MIKSGKRTPKTAEAYIVLDFIVIVEQKGQYIIEGMIKVTIDNTKVYRIINGKMDVPLKYI